MGAWGKFFVIITFFSQVAVLNFIRGPKKKISHFFFHFKNLKNFFFLSWDGGGPKLMLYHY